MIRLEAAGEPTLALHYQSATANLGDVVYVHGSTFGAALSVYFKFDGRSWADAMCEAGFNVWACDFAGYGDSDRYFQDGDVAVGRIKTVVPQLRRAIAEVRARNGGRPVSLVAHSWGGTVALRYAGGHAEDIALLALFAPVVARSASATTVTSSSMTSSHFMLTAWAQYRRFVEDVPRGETQPLSEAHFQAWSEAFLATDPAAASRTPPAVRTPCGPQLDWCALQSGQALYDPAGIAVPTLLVRGEWDSVCDDADASRLLSVIASTDKHYASIPKATHLMHLEAGRSLLYNAVNAFLLRSAT
jgi:alpha-beta hydrolase superfamily lysophospholipase